MKGTRAFQDTIKGYLDSMALEDPLFAEKYANPSKSLEECVDFILSEVQKSGMYGFTDPEIYSMAVHYYVEEDIKDAPHIDCQVIVNHHVELTTEEIEEMRQQAKERVLHDEMMRLRSSGKKASAPAARPVAEEENLLFSFD